MSISFKGFNEQILTFRTDSELEAGALVKMSDSGAVAACASGDRFIGAVISCHGDIAAVQVGGYISVPYSGSSLQLGVTEVSAADSTAVKSDSAGRTVTVIELDEANSTAGILL